MATPWYYGPECQLFELNAVLAHRGRLMTKGEVRVGKSAVHTFLLVSGVPHTQPYIIVLVDSPP